MCKHHPFPADSFELNFSRNAFTRLSQSSDSSACIARRMLTLDWRSNRRLEPARTLLRPDRSDKDELRFLLLPENLSLDARVVPLFPFSCLRHGLLESLESVALCDFVLSALKLIMDFAFAFVTSLSVSNWTTDFVSNFRLDPRFNEEGVAESDVVE